MARSTFEHRFVHFIPDMLEDGVLYVSIEFTTVMHKCYCGCGREVVTPISPAGWTLSFDGDSLTLDPSIGNWSFACRSHYWIERNRVVPARQWSEYEIEAGRARTARLKERYYSMLTGGDKDEA